MGRSQHNRHRKSIDRIVQPIFGTEPTEGRVVEPTEGWGTRAVSAGSGGEDNPVILQWFKIGEVVSPPPAPWEDDPMIQEWFKVGELLSNEFEELRAAVMDGSDHGTGWS